MLDLWIKVNWAWSSGKWQDLVSTSDSPLDCIISVEKYSDSLKGLLCFLFVSFLLSNFFLVFLIFDTAIIMCLAEIFFELNLYRIYEFHVLGCPYLFSELECIQPYCIIYSFFLPFISLLWLAKCECCFIQWSSITYTHFLHLFQFFFFFFSANYLISSLNSLILSFA